MLIKVLNPTLQTALFSLILLGVLLISIRKNRDENFFSKEVTNQLKGLAILAIVFSHVGYFLYEGQKFLQPLSNLSGVGVNIFLFLSGFGLTLSQLKSPLSPLSFYKKRLFRLFIPLWLVISAVLLLDYLLLKRTYPLTEVLNSFLGFFPRADVYQNIDSPLWYFSIILFYYLLFPLTFVKKIPLVSIVLILISSFIVLQLPLPIHQDTLKLYKLHTLAFPLGILFALLPKYFKWELNKTLKVFLLFISIAAFVYTAINSGVGEDMKIEQLTSLVSTLALVAIFSLSRLNFKLFSFFGLLSYEAYLLHWPILSRFNPFLQLPPFLATIFGLILVVILGYLLQYLAAKITNIRVDS